MGTNYNPRIVTNGLVLYLDAANPKSYPGSGTTWTDLSGNGRNGTLTNGPTFDSGNGGSLVFDGVNDRVDISSNFNSFGSSLGSGFTASYWLSTTETDLSSPYTGIVNTGSSNLIWAIFFNRGVGGRDNGSLGTTQFFIRSQTTGSYLVGWINTNIYDGKFHNVVWICSSPVNNTYTIYVDGVSVPVTYTDTNSPNSFANFDYQLPINAINARGSLSYSSTSTAQVSIYNRALTAAEIQQNFNATRGRYGI